MNVAGLPSAINLKKTGVGEFEKWQRQRTQSTAGWQGKVS